MLINCEPLRGNSYGDGSDFMDLVTFVRCTLNVIIVNRRSKLKDLIGGPAIYIESLYQFGSEILLKGVKIAHSTLWCTKYIKLGSILDAQ